MFFQNNFHMKPTAWLSIFLPPISARASLGLEARTLPYWTQVPHMSFLKSLAVFAQKNRQHFEWNIPKDSHFCNSKLHPRFGNRQKQLVQICPKWIGWNVDGYWHFGDDVKWYCCSCSLNKFQIGRHFLWAFVASKNHLRWQNRAVHGVFCRLDQVSKPCENQPSQKQTSPFSFKKKWLIQFGGKNPLFSQTKWVPPPVVVLLGVAGSQFQFGGVSGQPQSVKSTIRPKPFASMRSICHTWNWRWQRSWWW